MREHLDGSKKGQHDEGAAGRRTDGGAAPTADLAARRHTLIGLQSAAGNAAVAGVVQRWDWRDVVDPLGVTSALGGIVGFVMAGGVDQGQFKRDIYAARHRPIWRAEWDAWGHAVCGTCSAGLGGEGHAWLFGSGAEHLSELLRVLGIRGHDSFREDSFNQAVGRGIARRTGMGASAPELIRACTQAYLAGQMLVGPAREDAWLPWLGDREFFEIRRHEGKYWVANHAGPLSGSPAEWVEAVDPGERGMAQGSGRRPGTPIPAG